MILASIIAKVLALTDWFLGIFAVSGTSASTESLGFGLCGGNVVVMNAYVTPCGKEIIGTLVGTTELLLAALNGILPGVLAIQG